MLTAQGRTIKTQRLQPGTGHTMNNIQSRAPSGDGPGFARTRSKFSSFLCPILLPPSLVHNKHLTPQTPSQCQLVKDLICDTKCLFKPIANFPIELFFFFFVLPIYRSLLFNMDSSALSIVCVANIFSHARASIFYFFIVSLKNKSPSFGCNSISQFFFPF